jgi:hypothetical protein
MFSTWEIEASLGYEATSCLKDTKIKTEGPNFLYSFIK